MTATEKRLTRTARANDLGEVVLKVPTGNGYQYILDPAPTASMYRLRGTILGRSGKVAAVTLKQLKGE
jgi:hypothetical protein